MESFSHLSDFYEAIGNDARIGVSHISLYVAIMHQYSELLQSPIIIDSGALLQKSKN